MIQYSPAKKRKNWSFACRWLRQTTSPRSKCGYLTTFSEVGGENEFPMISVKTAPPKRTSSSYLDLVKALSAPFKTRPSRAYLPRDRGDCCLHLAFMIHIPLEFHHFGLLGFDNICIYFWLSVQSSKIVGTLSCRLHVVLILREDQLPRSFHVLLTAVPSERSIKSKLWPFG